MAVSYTTKGRLILGRLTDAEAEACYAFASHAIVTARAGREAAARQMQLAPDIPQFRKAAEYWDAAERFAMQLLSQMANVLSVRMARRNNDDPETT